MRCFGVVLVLASGCSCFNKPTPEPKRTVGVITVDAGTPTLVTDAGAIPPYNRDEWGRWFDADKDCQDTRQEVLVHESEVPVTFVDPLKPCRVLTGKWTDPYSGMTFSDPADLQIDHVVALEEAHLAGGWQWTLEQKKAYANDLANPHHLQAASVKSNTSKGSRPPPEWMPPNVAYRCEYLKRRLEILRNYKLKYDPDVYLNLVFTYCK
jgi:hypothetical protein